MRAVVQRVARAQVQVAGETIGVMGRGLLVLLGVGAADTDADIAWTVSKIATLRIFPDAADRFDQSVSDIDGGVLLISQFTLYGDVRRGRRPSFSAAAAPEIAAPMIDAAVLGLRALGLRVETGRFGTSMQVESINDGPVTILLDSASHTVQSG